MLFSFHCPTCKGKLEADASQSGAQASCPQCGNLVAVPEGRVDTGTTLAGFLLERRLGKGGMGEVYLARQLSVDRQVAVKILPPGFAADQQAVARFLQEGRLAARLDHHHIVTVHEAGEDSGNYYMAMAYVEGESLDQRLKRDGALPEAEALAMVRAVADALAYAWDEFLLLHRDLKPANIMLDRRGRVFLMDLGLAKSLGDGEGLTLSGTVLGTPQYMSPEQAQGLDLGVASDIYSLGATLYHLVTGAPPFTGDSLLKVLNQHVHEPLPPPRTRNPRLSEGCGRLIETMLAKKPEDRPRDWRTLVADIDRLLATPGATAAEQSAPPKPQAAVPTPAAPPVVVPSAPAEPPAREPGRVPPKATAKAPAPPPKRRLSAWQIGLVAVGVLLLVVLAVLALRGHRPAAVAEGKSPAAGPLVLSAAPVVGQAWTVPELGTALVPIAPGSFRMGSHSGLWYERPEHEVRISRGFWLGKYEVTQGEYEGMTGINPSLTTGATCPVGMISWQAATAFCVALTEREDAAGRLPTGYEYRLPTEAEWEYAAKGGNAAEGLAYAGSDSIEEVAWHRGNSADRLHPVGEKKPNKLGLHDLSGNAMEWCWDWYAQRYYDRSPATDPANGTSTLTRAMRGGSVYGLEEETRPTSRRGASPAYVARTLGFRLALAPRLRDDPPPAATAVAPAPGQDWTVPDLGTELVHVAPGGFRRSSSGKDDQGKEYEVRISRGFRMGRHEVTQAEYGSLTGNRPSKWSGDCNPAESVSWYEAAAFCRLLTERERAAGRIPAGYEYRLPTEAEWQFAAHGGAKSKGFHYAGSDRIEEVAWCRQNAGDQPITPKDDEEFKANRNRPRAVGGRKPNELGLHDLSGNVLEWGLDGYDEGYYARAPVADPVNLEAWGRRILSGTAFDHGRGNSMAKPSTAGNVEPTLRQDNIGFRVCLGPVVEMRQRRPVEGEAWTLPESGMEFVPVAPGAFRMGSAGGEAHEGPVHEVTISRAFWLGRYEVTQAEYEGVTGWNPSASKEPRNPVDGVSWHDAVALCRALTDREWVSGSLPDGYEYRLPTEAEWEYAARGGSDSKGFRRAGSDDLDEVAWHQGNGMGKVHPVGQRKANELGLHDLSGNLNEWCLDAYAAEYYARSGGSDPLNPPTTEGRRVVRGGSWWGKGVDITMRQAHAPWDKGNTIGLRVCLGPRLPEVTRTPNPVPTGGGPAVDQGWTVPEIGMAFVPVGPGAFPMGADAVRGYAGRPVRITRGFWLGRCEVSQAEYEALTGVNPSANRGPNLPVEMVSWHDAAAYCQALAERERTAGRLPAGYAFRLPTRAEWEFAGRGGPQASGRRFAGSDDPDEVAWYRANSGERTQPVGQKKANELGLHDDICGNVMEWCLDWVGNEWPSPPEADPAGPKSGTRRVARGFAICHNLDWPFASNERPPACSCHWYGFRVCLGPVIEGR